VPSAFTSAKLSPRDQDEAARLGHTWYYRPLRVFSDAHGYAFLYVAAAGLLAALLYPEYRNRETLGGVAGAIALAALLFLATHLLRTWTRRRRLRRRNAEFETWAFSDEGLLFRYRGSLRIERWTTHKSAVLSDRVLVLRLHKTSRKFRVVPIAELSSKDREQLLPILRENLGAGNIDEVSNRASHLRPNVVNHI
jgi:hypothetical protein